MDEGNSLTSVQRFNWIVGHMFSYCTWAIVLRLSTKKKKNDFLKLLYTTTLFPERSLGYCRAIESSARNNYGRQLNNNYVFKLCKPRVKRREENKLIGGEVLKSLHRNKLLQVFGTLLVPNRQASLTSPKHFTRRQGKQV